MRPRNGPDGIQWLLLGNNFGFIESRSSGEFCTHIEFLCRLNVATDPCNTQNDHQTDCCAFHKVSATRLFFKLFYGFIYKI